MLVSIDGRRTVTGIARRLGKKPVAICKILKPLVERSAIVFDRADTVALRDLPVVGAPKAAAEGEQQPAAAMSADDPAGVDGDAPASRRRARGPAFRVLARQND